MSVPWPSFVVEDPRELLVVSIVKLCLPLFAELMGFASVALLSGQTIPSRGHPLRILRAASPCFLGHLMSDTGDASQPGGPFTEDSADFQFSFFVLVSSGGASNKSLKRLK